VRRKDAGIDQTLSTHGEEEKDVKYLVGNRKTRLKEWDFNCRLALLNNLQALFYIVGNLCRVCFSCRIV
jgi:hypothetical protein